MLLLVVLDIGAWMFFKITQVQHYVSPENLDLGAILRHYDTSLEEIVEKLKTVQFIHQNNHNGFQMDLAKQLEDFFKDFFQTKEAYVYPCKYSPTMREKPDVSISRRDYPRKIFIEIEFRPNEHKDIVKFLIGHKQETLELGILVVAINRDIINKDYTTMPEYEKCIQTIKELQADCPMLILGFQGEWVPV